MKNSTIPPEPGSSALSAPFPGGWLHVQVSYGEQLTVGVGCAEATSQAHSRSLLCSRGAERSGLRLGGTLVVWSASVTAATAEQYSTVMTASMMFLVPDRQAGALLDRDSGTARVRVSLGIPES